MLETKYLNSFYDICIYDYIKNDTKYKNISTVYEFINDEYQIISEDEAIKIMKELGPEYGFPFSRSGTRKRKESGQGFLAKFHCCIWFCFTQRSLPAEHLYGSQHRLRHLQAFGRIVVSVLP